MVTGELRSKIDSLWEIFWTGGLTNPLDVIEQMTYLMFIHDLDDSDNLRICIRIIDPDSFHVRSYLDLRISSNESLINHIHSC